MFHAERIKDPRQLIAFRSSALLDIGDPILQPFASIVHEHRRWRGLGHGLLSGLGFFAGHLPISHSRTPQQRAPRFQRRCELPISPFCGGLAGELSI
jgi:hypothetical protein